MLAAMATLQMHEVTHARAVKLTTKSRGTRAASRTSFRIGGAHLPGRIQQWPLDRLKPFAKNPRRHSPQQVNRLVASMLEYGFTSPILVDGKGGIVAGHGRLLAARKLGLELVPVIELAHLTEIQRRAYLLADNKLALDADWDDALLLEQLTELGAESFDLAAAGFSPDELHELERAVQEAAAPARAPRGAPAGRILFMLEFDTQVQKDRWSEFLAWIRARAPDLSLGAALAEHATSMMKAGRER